MRCPVCAARAHSFTTGTALFRSIHTIVSIILTWAMLSGQMAWSQTDANQTTPSADLNAVVDSAQTPLPPDTVPATGADLFNDPPPPEGGWKGLARVLDTLTPSVDTSIPLTPSQITDRITGIINQGRYDEALRIIEQRKAQRQEQNLMGTDVQLLFLEGRALAASGQQDKAIDVYRDMTIKYPELPEPWNNLAAEYVRKNDLNMAERALQTALAINPQYASAQLNLGIVRLMLARDAFNQAARLGVSEARTLETRTTQLLQP